MNHLTIVQESLAKTNNHTLDNFNEAVKQIPEVESCLLIAGSFDYILKVRTRNISHFRELLGEQIGQLPDIMQTHSFAVMETIKESSHIHMNEHNGLATIKKHIPR